MRSDPDNQAVRSYYRQMKDIEEKKSAGDQAFRIEQYPDAISHWSACLDLTKDNKELQSKLFFNRSTASFKLKKYEDAVKDCTMAIYHDPEYIKAYLRRAECLQAMNVPEKIENSIR